MPIAPSPAEHGYALVCQGDPELYAAQRHPSADEGAAIADYRAQYRAAFGYWPHGLHFLRLEGAPEPVGVWFGPTA